jgi:hypothetical protein
MEVFSLGEHTANVNHFSVGPRLRRQCGPSFGDSPMSKAKEPKTVTFAPAKKTAGEKTKRAAQIGKAYLWRQVLHRTDLQHTTKLVAIWLYDHCKPGTYIATGSAQTIGDDLGMSARTVKSAIKELRLFKIVMAVNQYRNHRNVVFNTYTMRAYDDDQPRRKLLKIVKPKPEKSAPSSVTNVREMIAKAEAGELPTYAPPPVCPTCRGTKWESVPGKGARPCPACRKPKPTDKP